MPRKPTHPAQDQKTPVLEWIAASIGALLAATVLGVVVWHGISGTNTPADIFLEATRVAAGSGGTTVDISATNRGESTASEVTVEGRLGEETGTTVFDFIPGGATRKGSLDFRSAPESAQVDLRVLGYREP